MADVGSEQVIVTKFLLRTCQSRQMLNDEALFAVTDTTDNEAIASSFKTHCMFVTTGSVAEFYIQPMLSCVGDLDEMWHFSNQLAIPAGTAPPTELPDEFDSYVQVCEIVDSEFPGYVYLVSSYELRECIDDGKYNVVEYQHKCISYIVKIMDQQKLLLGQ